MRGGAHRSGSAALECAAFTHQSGEQVLSLNVACFYDTDPQEDVVDKIKGFVSIFHELRIARRGFAGLAS